MENCRCFALRFKIKIDAVQSNETYYMGNETVFKGSLDEIAFYEDPKMEKLIWKKQFKLLEDQPQEP